MLVDLGKTKKEISKDLDFLTTQWNKIREKTLKSSAPTIIYEEGSIIKRTIRDMLTNDVEEIYVEGSQWSTVNYQYSSKILKDVRNNYKNYRFIFFH